MATQLIPRFATEQVGAAVPESGANSMGFIGRSDAAEEDSDLTYEISGAAEFWESAEYRSALSAVQREASLAEERHQKQHAATLAASMLELGPPFPPRHRLSLEAPVIGEVNDSILG